MPEPIDPDLFAENERTAPQEDTRRLCAVGDMTLVSGEVLPGVVLAYETWGELNAAKDNAILVCHALSGDSHAVGWWDRIVGPGKALDTDKYFVVCSNALGGCQGSTGPTSLAPDGVPFGRRFPFVTVEDMVDAQAVLADSLGVSRWLMVCGGSMGGMFALEWARRYPARVAKVWMTASCAAHSAMQIGFNEAGRQSILRDPEYMAGGEATQGLAVARMVGHLSYLSYESFETKFGRNLQDGSRAESGGYSQFAVESYLNYQGDKFTKRFSSESYLVLTRAIDAYDGRDVRTVKSEFLLTSFTSDWIYPTQQSRELGDLLTSVSRVQHFEIELPFGHDSFLLDGKCQAEYVKSFILNLQ